MNKNFSVFLLLSAAALLAGCPGKNNPSNPNDGGSGPNATATVTFTPTATSTHPPTATPTATIAFVWTGATVFRAIQNLTSASTTLYHASVVFTVNGTTPSTAAVTLTDTNTAGVTLALPYSFILGVGSYKSTNTFSYIPGDHYKINISYSGQTTSAVFPAPGGIQEIKDMGYSNAVSEAVWGHTGNNDFVQITENSPNSRNTLTTQPATTPFLITEAGLTGAYPDNSTSDYDVVVQAENDSTAITNGTISAGASIVCFDKEDVEVSFPTCTGVLGYSASVGVTGTAPTPECTDAWMSQINVPSATAITSILFYVPSGATGECQTALYTDNGASTTSDRPLNLVTFSTAQTVNPGAWNTFPVTGARLSAGKYWLAFQYQNCVTTFPYASGGIQSAYSYTIPFGSFPATLGSADFDTIDSYLIYANTCP